MAESRAKHVSRTPREGLGALVLGGSIVNLKNELDPFKRVEEPHWDILGGWPMHRKIAEEPRWRGRRIALWEFGEILRLCYIENQGEFSLLDAV